MSVPVRDFSKASVTIAPADFASWADARADLVTEKKRPLKAQMEAEIAGVEGDEAIETIRNKFAAQERALENEIDHTPLEMHLSMAVSYKYAASRNITDHPTALRSRNVGLSVPLPVQLPHQVSVQVLRVFRKGGLFKFRFRCKVQQVQQFLSRWPTP